MNKDPVMIFIEDQYKTQKRRITVATRQIVYVLQKSTQALSQQQIFKKVQKKNANLNVTTVYRVLDRLVEINAIHKINSKFMLCSDPYNTHESHHFLRCKTCGKYEEIFLDYFDSMQTLLQEQKQFQFQSAEMLFLGTCKDCQDMSKKSVQG
jgi:Fe2+ or Zn2+ uptake regulation protein